MFSLPRTALHGFAALALLAAAPAQAETIHYTLDKPHTQILFFVGHMGVSKSQGEFLDYEGKITFVTDKPEQSSVEATIRTASIDMGDAKWDEHMKNADFFDVEKFPEMTFKSTSIAVTGDKTADIIGDLTLLGVTKPVTLKAEWIGSGKHAMSGKDLAGFSATGNLKRSDFGMNYGIPMVGDEVEIRIEVEAVAQETPTGEGPGNH